MWSILKGIGSAIGLISKLFVWRHDAGQRKLGAQTALKEVQTQKAEKTKHADQAVVDSLSDPDGTLDRLSDPNRPF